MIVVYAGRRPSDDDRGLPAPNVEFLDELLLSLMAGMRPTRVVGSGAAGTDLLAARAARLAGAKAEMIVAGDPDTFKATSVADKGTTWSSVFDGLRADPGVRLVAHGSTSDDAAYAAVNAEILRVAADLCAEGERIVVVVVTAGRDTTRVGPDHTEDLADAAGLAGHLVLRLDPTVRREDAPVAFVAMPFGEKPDPARPGGKWHCDATWHRILLPALLGAGYRPYRVDVDGSTEIIDRKMLRAIARTDLFVADLALGNPNVMWELGVRHALVRSGTVLVSPGGPPPFDVARVPVLGYVRGPARVTDEQATTSIRGLVAALGSRRGRDSPVYAAIPELVSPTVPPEDAEDRELVEFLGKVSRASDLRDVHELRSLAAALPGRWSAGVADDLTVRIGYALVRLDDMANAADVLEPVARRDTAFARTLLQETYALALIHSSAGVPGRLRLATRLLRILAAQRPASAETAGLQGSAAKRTYEADPAAPDALDHVRDAAEAYERGFTSDPTDTYAGVNAVALLGALARRADPDGSLSRRVSYLLPVLRFALRRPEAREDPWFLLTDAETRLLAFLAGETADAGPVLDAYRTAVRDATPQQVSSAARQVRLLARLGGHAAVLDQVAVVLIAGTS